MKLSILIASVHTRRHTFLQNILENVYGQYEKLPEEQQKEVEILVFIDNKKTMLGDKRNLMIEQSQGDYVVFVDDDDVVADDYISSLLAATEEGSDVITFKVEVTLNGGEAKLCHYSKDFEGNHNAPEAYYRIPNHICCVKRELAEQVQFPSVLYGEDTAYANLLKPFLKTETSLEKVLYFYRYNSESTETQLHLPERKRYNRGKIQEAPILDLIILSNAKDEYFASLTEQAIETARNTAPGYHINFIVMEQNNRVFWPKPIQTVYYNYEFNYNRLANEGARMGTAPYIMVANNDLVFKEGWLSNLLRTNEAVVSPKCPLDTRHKGITQNAKGLELIKNFSGWCFMLKRTVFEDIGGFDEDFGFWFADNAVLRQLGAKGYQSMLVADSLVEHLGSQTLKTLPEAERKEKTIGQAEKYNEKYHEQHFR